MKAKPLFILIVMVALFTAILSAACQSTGATAVSQEEKIATACTATASGLDAVTAAFLAGRVKRDVLVSALAIKKSTNPWCQPVATSLSLSDFDKLSRAALELSALGSTK